MSNITELTQSLIHETSFNNKKNAEQIFEVLKKEHRTNQASFIRTISELLELYSNQEGDMRNLGAIEYAKNATQSNVETIIPYI